jgi:hypothetical protein
MPLTYPLSSELEWNGCCDWSSAIECSLISTKKTMWSTRKEQRCDLNPPAPHAAARKEQVVRAGIIRQCRQCRCSRPCRRHCRCRACCMTLHSAAALVNLSLQGMVAQFGVGRGARWLREAAPWGGYSLPAARMDVSPDSQHRESSAEEELGAFSSFVFNLYSEKKINSYTVGPTGQNRH